MGAKIELQCDNCGKTFFRYKSNQKGSKNVYCSKACMIEHKKGEKEERTCLTCGKKFFVYKSSIEKSNTSGNYCCRDCYNEHLRTLVGDKSPSYKSSVIECCFCGKPVITNPYRMKTYNRRFCSIECKTNFYSGENAPNWKGGYRSYRGNFEIIKKECFGKTNFCALCGTTKNIHIHHIIPYRLTEDNSLDNLIPLCSSHHKIFESASLQFIEMMEDDYEAAKWYLNNILRTRQNATRIVIKEVAKNGRKFSD